MPRKRKPAPTPARRALEISVRVGGPGARATSELLRRVARHAAEAEGFRDGLIGIEVVDDDAMTALHEEYMDESETTDVLTFDFGGNPKRGLIDGNIFVCADVAARRTSAAPRPQAAARRELALYVVHGVLHLAGYDDRRKADFRRMHAREDELLLELGLGAVFRNGELGGR